MTPSDIISRLEKATGPYRELNRQIAKHFGWFRVEPRFSRNKNGGWIAPEDFTGTYADGSPILDGLHGTTIHGDVPNFTASLDATIALVEKVLPGARIDITKRYDGDGYACVWGPNGNRSSNAATPAIALLLALFRALPSEKDNG